MSDGISAWRDDMSDYQHLCNRFGIEVQYDGIYPDCYGVHASKIKQAEQMGMSRILIRNLDRLIKETRND